MRFAVKFLGCKVSQADVMMARRRLLEAGHEEVPDTEAELHVVNTCCITREAEAKSRQSVRGSLKTARKVFVGGCAVNLHPEQFAEIDPAVKVFRGNAEEVASAMAGTPLPHAPGGGCVDVEHDVLLRGARSRSARVWTGSRVRGFVKVQDGCDCSCAYCIIPTVRGRARSRAASAVLDEVEHRAAQGQREVVMTGISVGDYRDPERGLDLGELLVQAARVSGVERVRVSSIEVIHVTGSIVTAMREEPKICPHLHVPMQSGDDDVLQAMGRHYTAGEYLDTIRELRTALPGVNLTTDVIVGFPNEDDRAFQNTLDAVEAAGISRVHIFPYSARPGTAAEALGDRVPPEEKKRRSRALRGLAEVRSRHHRTTKLAQPERVLIDKVAETQCSGYSADYTRCYLPAGAGDAGELLDVTIQELHADGLLAMPSGTGAEYDG
jgi:threonylcarbamoyladenosine tRNA methylthiotransferase MtaB